MANKKTILLVDDNEADNVYHQIILRRSELVGEVMVTESAVSAMHYLQHVARQWPNLILVDVNMPGMDGFALVSELQYLSPPAYCKVAMLTSSDADRDRDRARKLTLISAYIIKPLTVPSIVQLLVE
ncbi:MAG: response regulator [Solimonas sp.]